MSEESSSAIVITVAIDDPVLAGRLASLLDGVEGLRVAAPGEAATVAEFAGAPSDKSGSGQSATRRRRNLFAGTQR